MRKSIKSGELERQAVIQLGTTVYLVSLILNWDSRKSQANKRFREIPEISSINAVAGRLISEILGLTSFCLMLLLSIARLSPHVFYKLPQNL